MSVIDSLIVIVYVLGLLFLAWRLSKTNKTQDDYFIGGRSMPFIPVALSIAATTISANGFVGGPGWAYHDGMAAFMLQFSIPLVMLLASIIFVPFLYNLKITSVYQYIQMRFGRVSYLLAALTFLATSVMLISGMVYIPALIVQQITGWGLTLIVPVMVVIVIAYTMIGGIKAVIWTDTIQMLILWVGLIATVIIALSSTNMSFGEVLAQSRANGLMDAMNFSLDISREGGVWVALFGGLFMWLQYFGTDQSQMQRMLASRSVKSAKISLCTSALVMNIMYFIFMLVGLIMFSYYAGREFASSNLVMIDFILTKLPVGLLGLMISAVFAAGMSSMDSLLNSMTTVFVKDIYEPYLKKDHRETGLKVSIIFTAVFGVVIALFTILGFGGTTASVLKTVGSYTSLLAGSLLAMFLLGMFTKKAHEKGVVVGYLAGLLATWGLTFTSVNWLWYAMVGCVVSFVVGYLASLLLPGKAGEEHLTLMGLRKNLQAKGVDKAALPGSWIASDWVVLGFFVVQVLVLLQMS